MIDWTFFLVGLTQFAYISSRAFQQLNVMHHKVKWLYLTSFVMAMCEVTIFGALGARAFFSFSDGFTLSAAVGFAAVVFPLWLGGSTGSHFAMTIHKRFR